LIRLAVSIRSLVPRSECPGGHRSRNRILPAGARKLLEQGVGAGIYEYKIDFGPGYRIYFDKEGEHLIILLGGSSKKGQQAAIEAAKSAWAAYKRATPESKVT
jgi:putative addiction module killer protein